MTKVIVFTHGVPGSGKSYLAEKLAKENNGQVFSTDDFFMKDGEYKWSFDYLSAAHEWNFGRTAHAMFNGIEYIVVANTNLQKWQIVKYVELAARLGYDFEIVEPKTKWKYDAAECAKKNTHGVPLASIEKMLKDREDPKKFGAELREKYYKGK